SSNSHHHSGRSHGNERERESRTIGQGAKNSVDIEPALRMINYNETYPTAPTHRSHHSHKTTATSYSSDEREQVAGGFNRPLSPDRPPSAKRGPGWRKPPPSYEPSPPPSPPKT